MEKQNEKRWETVPSVPSCRHVHVHLTTMLNSLLHNNCLHCYRGKVSSGLTYWGRRKTAIFCLVIHRDPYMREGDSETNAGQKWDLLFWSVPKELVKKQMGKATTSEGYRKISTSGKYNETDMLVGSLGVLITCYQQVKNLFITLFLRPDTWWKLTLESSRWSKHVYHDVF